MVAQGEAMSAIAICELPDRGTLGKVRKDSIPCCRRPPRRPNVGAKKTKCFFLGASPSTLLRVRAGLRQSGMDCFVLLTQGSQHQSTLGYSSFVPTALACAFSPMIDPKPFAGDPAYDLTQHLLNPAVRQNPCTCRIAEQRSTLGYLHHPTNAKQP